ncbi:hypothetical protein O181_068505 [Austropuccinia psidii MF-1]|uniref:Integrase catalytic domain-containing protein n=1 Tax=Austropuccinia psidii MF-1 TaxID=1389203 RepID=A0A9Q3I749_9BASI|nr:hypothetical protein [Austropuccinia psidii MF-1]
MTGLPPGSNRSYNSFLVIVYRFSRTPILLPCHKDHTSMDTALLICNRVVSWTGIFTNIINDRDTKFTSALWTNLHQLFGIKLSFSTAYHSQTDGLSKIMIQTVEDIVTRVFAYGPDSKIVMDSAIIGVPLYLHWNWNIKHPFIQVAITFLLF